MGCGLAFRFAHVRFFDGANPSEGALEASLAPRKTHRVVEVSVHHRSTMKLTVVVQLPPRFSVWARPAPANTGKSIHIARVSVMAMS